MDHPLNPPTYQELLRFYIRSSHFDHHHVNRQLARGELSRRASIESWLAQCAESFISPNSYFSVEHYSTQYGVPCHLSLYDFLTHGWQVDRNPNPEISISQFVAYYCRDTFLKRDALTFLVRPQAIKRFSEIRQPGMRGQTITIITINLNNRDGLASTLQSIAEQRAVSFELIVVDGGSSDGSLEAIDVSTREPDRLLIGLDNGIYDAMNLGVGYSRGDYVLYMNSGDTFQDHNSLATMQAALGIHDIVYGLVRFQGRYSEHPYHTKISRGMVMCHQAQYIRREWLQRHPLKPMLQVADLETIQTMYIGGATFYCVPEIVAAIEPDGYSSSNPVRNYLERFSLCKNRFSHPGLRKEFIAEAMKRDSLRRHLPDNLEI